MTSHLQQRSCEKLIHRTLQRNQSLLLVIDTMFTQETLIIAPATIHLGYKLRYADGEDIAPTRQSLFAV
jgi:hypothetical protein